MTATLTETRAGGFARPKRVACYPRLSEAKNDGKGGSLAIDRQCFENHEYIRRAIGADAEIVCFPDDGFSAFLDIYRPGFEDMIAQVEARKFDAAVAWHADRITRQVEVMGRVVRVCETTGTQLHTTLGGWHTDPTKIYIETTISEGESRQKRNRAISKHEQLKRDGGFSGGGRQFGFNERNKGVREDEAAIIRHMAERLLSGESATSVVKWLNTERIPTARGAAKWTIATVKSMLVSDRLIGKRNGVDAEWPAILDVWVHEALRALLLDPARDPRKGKASNRYLLSGIATCGKCGGQVGGSWITRRNLHIYRCVTTWDFTRPLEDADWVVSEYVIARLSEIDAKGVLTSDADNQELSRLVLDRDETIPAARRDLESLLESGALDPVGYAAGSSALARRDEANRQAIAALSSAMTAPMRALEGVTGPSARAVWESWQADTSGAGLARMRAVVRLLVDVQFLPAKAGRGFDPNSVAVSYRDLG